MRPVTDPPIGMPFLPSATSLSEAAGLGWLRPIRHATADEERDEPSGSSTPSDSIRRE